MDRQEEKPEIQESTTSLNNYSDDSSEIESDSNNDTPIEKSDARNE